MSGPLFKVYDKVNVFGRTVTIIDIGVYNNEYIYTAESEGGYESFSEDCINIKKDKAVEPTFKIGQEVVVINAEGLNGEINPMEKGIVRAIDNKDICYVEFDGVFDWLMISRSIGAEDNTLNELQGRIDKAITDYLNKLDGK